MPEITVITPTWNRRTLLLEAVASVRAQTFRDWELIVVDDGSTDGSADALSGLADGRIRVLSLPHTGDVAGVRNAGADSARAPWLAFLDSDDLWQPQKLELQRSAVRADGARWSCTGYELIDETGRPIPFRAGSNRVRSGHILRDLLTMDANVTICTVLVERALFGELGGFRADAGREDYDFLLRLAARAPVAAVAEALARVRDHPARSTHALDSPHLASLRVIERFLERERDPELRHLARSQAARQLLEGARYESGHGRPGRAWAQLARSLRYGPPGLLWSRALAAMALSALGLRR